MKNSRISLLLLFAGFLVSYQPQARAWGDSRDCCEPQCCDQVYDCVGIVLIVVGISCVWWRSTHIMERSWQIIICFCNALAIPDFGQDIVNLFQLPKFNKLFRTPWVIGGWLGYALSDNVEVYLEFNYRQDACSAYTVAGVDFK